MLVRVVCSKCRRRVYVVGLAEGVAEYCPKCGTRLEPQRTRKNAKKSPLDALLEKLPLTDVGSRERPFYLEEMQRVCLEVRRRNCGINGTPTLFYAKRGGSPSSLSRKARKLKTKACANKQYAPIVDAIRALGLASATADQVGAAVKSLFPGGTEGTGEPEIIRAVFVHLQRRVTAGNVER